jgi:Ca-activated chloride channel family protein
MQRRYVPTLASLLLIIAALCYLAAAQEPNAPAAADAAPDTPGALVVLDKEGRPQNRACPLKHTDVQAEITGFLARVTVTQEFTNPYPDKIEAVYTFPLSQNAAVDDMTMQVGDHTVRGKILRREEAQAVYEAARNAGQVAGLLDQERPNIFTQSVANITPGARVIIKISYVETLKYEAGTYEFVFPMVVGPRYVPGTPTGRQGGGYAPDTTSVPDASRITPRPAPAGTRAGHDISLSVKLDAGLPLDAVASTSHEIELDKAADRRAVVRLKDSATLPNKDFILRYDVAGKQIGDALLTHRDARGGFFTFILQPPERVEPAEATPREIVFVLDTSGSMNGFPIEKAKETMKLALEHLNPLDTFNLITFAGDTHILFPQPVAPTPANLTKAQAFLAARRGEGGTEMMKAIRAALDPSDAQAHLRVVCFMTDGYVGNDMAIIGEVQKHPNARVFSFGIGSSVNRFLLDKMAEAGRGEVEYVTLESAGSAAAKRFYERVRDPLLTDIELDWGGLPVADVYPRRIPDLFGAKPVVVTGRYTAGGRGTLKLRGRMRGREFVRELPVVLPEAEADHDVLAPLWARRRVDDLMNQDMTGLQQNNMRPDLRETITQLGLEFRLLTQFTSFVAVEELIVTDGGAPRRVDVPVEVPAGVNRDTAYPGEAGTQVAVSRSYMNFALTKNSVAAGSPPPLLRGTMTESVTVTAAPNTTTTDSATIGRTYSANELWPVGGGSPSPASPARKSRPKGEKSSGTGRGTPVSSGAQPTPAPTPTPDAQAVAAAAQAQAEAEARARLLVKLHPKVAALLQRLERKETQAAEAEAKFVRADKAELQVWLTDKTPELLAQLKQLGFDIIVEPQTAKLLIGRLPTDKLAALAALKEVRYVAPYEG